MSAAVPPLSGPPPSVPPGDVGHLVVDFRTPSGLFTASLISPQLAVDGYPAHVHWGRNVLPIVPGRHVARCSSRYLFEYGSAEQVFDSYPGQTVELHYSAPLITLIGGAIGFTPQPRPGRIAYWVIIGVALLVPVLAIIGIIVAVNG